MKRRRLYLASCCLLVVLAVSVAAAFAQRNSRNLQKITVGALEREYRLHVPANLPDALTTGEYLHVIAHRRDVAER